MLLNPDIIDLGITSVPRSSWVLLRWSLDSQCSFASAARLSAAIPLLCRNGRPLRLWCGRLVRGSPARALAAVGSGCARWGRLHPNFHRRLNHGVARLLRPLPCWRVDCRGPIIPLCDPRPVHGPPHCRQSAPVLGLVSNVRTAGYAFIVLFSFVTVSVLVVYIREFQQRKHPTQRRRIAWSAVAIGIALLGGADSFPPLVSRSTRLDSFQSPHS
jgi:hypothetical protein